MIACGVCLTISVVLFIVLHIPKVISDLTGRTAKKAIENIRLKNEQSGDRTSHLSAERLQRRKHQTGRLPHNDAPLRTGAITDKISTQRLPPEESADETSILIASDGSSVSDSSVGETEVLDASELQISQVFTIEFEITFIQTDEVIALEEVREK